MAKLGIIGLGRVGSQILTDIQNEHLFQEIVLIDERENIALGEALDHHHVSGINCSTNTLIKAGTYDDLHDTDMIIITASVQSNADMVDRVTLAKDNGKIIKSIMKKVSHVTKDAIILNVTNPVDAISYVASHYYDKKKFIGTGTMLETARFKTLIADHYNIDPKSVEAFVIGEHGMNAVPVWSKVRIFGMDIEEFERLSNKTPINQKEITNKIDKVAFEVLHNKGWTNTAISKITVNLAKTILFNEHSIHSVTSVANEYGYKNMSFGLPTLLSKNGVEQRFEIELNEEEHAQLEAACNYIQEAIELANE